jgi:hypothetical protein
VTHMLSLSLCSSLNRSPAPHRACECDRDAIGRDILLGPASSKLMKIQCLTDVGARIETQDGGIDLGRGWWKGRGCGMMHIRVQACVRSAV